MTEYLVGNTVVLEAQYYSEGDMLIDPDPGTTPSCEIHDSRGRVIQTNIPTVKITTGIFQAYFVSTGLPKGTYSYIFSAIFEGKPSLEPGKFILTTV